MAIIYFDDTVIRQQADGRPILFAWPRSGALFTYQYSINGGQTFTQGMNVITEFPVDGDVAEYQIPYNPVERPAGSGTVVYKINDGTDEGKIYVNILLATQPLFGPNLPQGQEAFTSLEEMERVFSVEGVSNHTEDYTSDPEVNSVINEIIYRATETVLQFLRGRYAASDMANSYWVRMKATFIAVYYLSIRQGNPSLYGDMYAEAMLDLAQARDGIINPGLKTNARMIVQTPMMDSRFFHPGRINPARSTRVYSGQRLPYRLANYE